MTIQIDNRKGSAELQPHISAPTTLARLEFADFAFLGNGPDSPVSIGIERKALRDLVSSIISGRLSGHQLIGLMNSYDYVYIVVDGPFKTGNDGYIRVPQGRKNWAALTVGSKPVPRALLDSYLNSLLVTCGIYHEFLWTNKLTGQWLTSLYKWWQKPWSSHKAHLGFHTPPPKKTMFKKPTLVHRMIKEIDKVGWDKGLAISKKFSSIAEIVMSSEKDLMKVDGVGKILAKRIRNALWGET